MTPHEWFYDVSSRAELTFLTPANDTPQLTEDELLSLLQRRLGTAIGGRLYVQNSRIGGGPPTREIYSGELEVLNAQVIPEPDTLVLSLVGMAGLVARRALQRQRASG
ncbi:PEP-CTERM domain protein [Caldimonas brevitalea]|uniref:Ice-binding protein C-terminal domain-containing protein n=1 Tax=Caldimonas brevitalea TaxID=413882 RepID=A0A0G3BUB7_9BURK|nr:PEP-CTERM domain protein [Caldimonas brevitalea]AKJ30125.1 hypothetical protein AAW51_3434 [Caldimonas brevitalea]